MLCFPALRASVRGLSATIKTKALNQLPPTSPPALNSQRLPSGQWRRWCSSSARREQLPWNRPIFLSFVLRPQLVALELIKGSESAACMWTRRPLAVTSTNQNEIWNIKFPTMCALVKRKKKKEERGKGGGRRGIAGRGGFSHWVMWNIWCGF